MHRIFIRLLWTHWTQQPPSDVAPPPSGQERTREGREATEKATERSEKSVQKRTKKTEVGWTGWTRDAERGGF